MTARVLLGLGANLGDRRANLRAALGLLEAWCRVLAVSSLYQSAAMVPAGASPGPDFLNAACEVETDLTPHQLRAFVKEIERTIGREPAPRWSARLIDIDILLYGERVVDDEELVIPHPAMTERHFVMAPLAEIAPDAVHPVLGKVIGELAEDVDFAGLEYVSGPGWASGEAEPDEEEDEGADGEAE